MKISASIVLYNTKLHDIDRLYKSVVESKCHIDLTFIDNSLVPCINPENYPEANYFHMESNLGYGSAHNRAIFQTIESHDFHLILNPDVYFTEDVIPELVRFMSGNSEIGLIMPRIENPDGSLQYLCRLLPTPFDLFFRRFLYRRLNKLLKNHLDIHDLRFTGYSEIMEVPFLSGCFMMISMDAIKKVGAFDERFFMYAEDLDLSRRINERYKTVFYPDVKIVHDHARESYKSMKMLNLHIRSTIQYFNKWGWFFDKKRRATNSRILKKLKIS